MKVIIHPQNEEDSSSSESESRSLSASEPEAIENMEDTFDNEDDELPFATVLQMANEL